MWRIKINFIFSDGKIMKVGLIMNWSFIKTLQRIYNLLDELDKENTTRDYPIIWEKVHATSCAQIGRMLAEKRNLDPEPAALACALHDIGRWISGQQTDHALKGEEPVRRFLREWEGEESIRELIVKAVINHSKKEEIGGWLEELVKDADILDCYWHGDSITKSFHILRLEKVLSELGIGSAQEEL